MRTPTSPPAQPGYQPPSPDPGPTGPGRLEEVRATETGDVRAEQDYGAYRDAEGNLVEQRQEVVEDTYQRRSNLRYAVTTIISLLFGVLEVILLLRLVFRLLGANTQSDFISWLYGVSHPFVAPFNGIFNDQALGSHGVFEMSTVIALLIYGLIAWGVTWMVDAALRPGPTSRERLISTRRRQF